MAIILDKYGGTDPVDGDILVAANWTDTLNETSGYHRKTSTNPGGDINFTAGSFGIAGSIIFGTSGNGLWTAFHDTVVFKGAGGGNNATIRYRVSGANFGVKYILKSENTNAFRGLPNSGLYLGGSTAGLIAQGADGVNIIGRTSMSLSEPIVDDNMVIYLEMDDAGATTGTVSTWDMRVDWIKGWIED